MIEAIQNLWEYLVSITPPLPKVGNYGSTHLKKKLNTEWQSIAKCDLKMATVYTRWADVDAMNSSKNRFAMWNWCDLKERVTSITHSKARYSHQKLSWGHWEHRLVRLLSINRWRKRPSLVCQYFNLPRHGRAYGA